MSRPAEEPERIESGVCETTLDSWKDFLPFAAKRKEHQSARIPLCHRNQFPDLCPSLVVEFDQTTHVADLAAGPQQNRQKMRMPREFPGMLQLPSQELLPLIRDPIEIDYRRQANQRFYVPNAIEHFQCRREFALPR